ncbi:MAG: hypothetical protein WAL35_00610 [Acidimicrobiales bacterium]
MRKPSPWASGRAGDDENRLDEEPDVGVPTDARQRSWRAGGGSVAGREAR